MPSFLLSTSADEKTNTEDFSKQISFFLMPCFCLTVSEEMFHDEFDSFREQKDYIKNILESCL